MAKIKFPVVLSLVLVVGVGQVRAADVDKVDSAKTFLTEESRAKAILFFMHPTADYQSLTFSAQTRVVDEEKNELEGWFCLEYRFNWKSAIFDDSHYTFLKAFFDDGGKLRSIQAGKTSTFARPFGAADIVIAAVKDEVIKSFKDDPDAQDLIRSLIDKSDAKGLLTFLLRQDQK